LAAAGNGHPLIGYAATLVLGLAPTALVTHFYNVLPNRVVIRWDSFGNVTIVGTRPDTILMVANVAAVLALASIAVAIWQQKALVALGMRRAYLALNLAQIVAINLVSAMIVSDALGLRLTIKPMVPPAMAVLLFAAGILCRRMDQNAPNVWARTASLVLLSAGPALLIFSAIGANAVVGYYASGIAVVAMAAIALPPSGALRPRARGG